MAQKPKDPLQDYLGQVAAYEREFKTWEGRVDKILKRYRDDKRDTKNRDSPRFNILWSNVQTLVQATYSRVPQPDVSRRFRDQDPVGRVASLILERALEFEVQHYPDYQATLKADVHDRFLGGRGTAWIRYEPHIKTSPDEPEDGVQITEDTDEAPVNEQLDYECAPTDYVHWKDFGHSVARSWEEVTQVWRKVYMSEGAVKERFGSEIAKKIPYDATPEDLKRREKNEETVKKQALVYELWDKEKGVAVWFSKAMKKILDTRDDPLGLKDFFPCPRPLFATMTNDSLVPVPDFTLYQDQANELDVLAERIDGLVKMLQLKGVYDGSADPAIARLFTEGESGTLMPIKNWAAFAEKQGLKGSVDVFDMTPIGHALEMAQAAMEQVKTQVYEITGISDLIRGETAPSETATAQQIKGNYASLRLKGFQTQVAYFATELLQLKAQIMCSKFAPETLLSIAAAEQFSEADKALIPEAMVLLIGAERMQNPEAETPNPLRTFRVEVAADTLVQMDEEEEKEKRMEMLTAFGVYVQKVAEVGAMAPQLAPLLIDIGKFGLTSFKIGKTIEGSFDQALEQLKQQAAQPKPPQVPPEVQVEQMKQQTEQQKLAADQQRGLEEMAMKAQQADKEMQQKDVFHQRETAMKDEQHKRECEQQDVAHQREMQMMGQKHDAEMGMKKEQNEESMTLERQKLAAANPETAPVDKEGNSAASPTMQMAEGMTEAVKVMSESINQTMQTLAQIAESMSQMMKEVNQSMRVAAGPKKLTRDPRTGEKMVVSAIQ